jgi:hypothetical protein
VLPPDDPVLWGYSIIDAQSQWRRHATVPKHLNGCSDIPGHPHFERSDEDFGDQKPDKTDVSVLDLQL